MILRSRLLICLLRRFLVYARLLVFNLEIRPPVSLISV